MRALFVMALFGYVVFAPVVGLAELFFTDDFSDLSVTNDVPVTTDGTPVRWVPDPAFTALDASSGDLVLSANGEFAGSFAEQLILANTSVRTQLRRIDDRDIIGVGVRGSEFSPRGYTAGFGSGGGIFLTRIEEDSSSEVLRAVPTGLNPTHEEVLLQFDVIGSRLEVWAWRPEDPMPNNPQISILDSAAFSDGIVGLFVGAVNSSRPKEGTFRFVQVASAQIKDGDFDFDKDIDGEDFLLWQRGKSFVPHSAEDFAAWQANYGAPSSLAFTQPLPEPSGALLVAMFVVVGTCRMRLASKPFR